MLTEKKELYDKIREMDVLVDIHAIYDPDEEETGIYKGCYLAAVDLFKPGMTFRVYFTLDENGEIDIFDVSRWRFG